MGTINKSGSTVTAGQIPAFGGARMGVLKNTVDLSKAAIVQGDVYQMLAVPAGVKIVEVYTKILTPAVGTTLTMDVGDGTDPNGWDASVDGKAAANTYAGSANGTDALAAATTNGTLYTTGDSIDITMTTATAITAGPKLSIYAAYIDYR